MNLFLLTTSDYSAVVGYAEHIERDPMDFSCGDNRRVMAYDNRRSAALHAQGPEQRRASRPRTRVPAGDGRVLRGQQPAAGDPQRTVVRPRHGARACRTTRWCGVSVHVEWLAAHDTRAEVIGPGEDWVAADHQHPSKYVLALSIDEVTAIEGSLPELRALAARITAVVASVATAVEAGARP